MPAPRVFVSSTCYDLQDVRHALRKFITDFGFEPVMSEFGDIFYPYEVHVQDACIAEIEKCNLFVLIIGNQYGSLYYREHEKTNRPSSVTLEEFRKAISVEIPKHVFINRFTQHDYRNFRRHLDQMLKEYFDKNEVSDKAMPEAIQTVRSAVDEAYPFAQAAYRYIFYFLDEISDLKVNNAILPFEAFSDITEQLKRQWAGLMYEALASSRSVSSSVVQEVTGRLNGFEKILRQLVSSKKEEATGEISLNIEAISKSLAPAELEQAQEIVESSTRSITHDGRGQARGLITEDIDHKKILTWLDSLGPLLKNYKWAKTILFEEVLGGMRAGLRYYTKRDREIPTWQIMRLHGLYQNLPKKERESFARSVLLKLRAIVQPERDRPSGGGEDIPF